MPHFDCNFCESDHLFGRSGVCDTENETCVCPEGFSGEDDWTSFSGCQVDDQLRHSLHLGFSILCGVGLVVSVICFFALARRWKFKISSQKNMFVAPKFEKYSSNKNLQNVALRNWRRKVFTLYSMIAYIFYFIGGLMYVITLLNGGSIEEAGPVALVGMYMIVAFSIPGGFLVVVVWYFALPDVSKFGGLLNMHWLIVTYPDFIPQLLLCIGIVLEVILFFVALVLPLSHVEADVLHICSQIVICLLITYICVCLGSFWLTMRTVERVFGEALRTFEQHNSGKLELFDKVRQQELKFIKKAMIPLRAAKYMCIAVMMFDIALELTNMATGATQTYFFLGLNFTAFCLFMLTAPICFVLLESYLTPKPLLSNDISTHEGSGVSKLQTQSLRENRTIQSHSVIQNSV